MEETVEVFGFSERRHWLLEGLRLALVALGGAGCRLVYVDGSFVTAKEEPRDYDICWDMEGVDLELLDPVIQDVRPPRAAQQAKYRGDILPNVIETDCGLLFVEFFQLDRESGEPKGIAAIDPRGVI